MLPDGFVIAGDATALGDVQWVKLLDPTPGSTSPIGVAANPLVVVGAVSVGNFPASFAVSNFPATQAVSGPLTDTQLRAAPVPVSGTFWQATQPVSIAGSVTTDVSDRAARLLGHVTVDNASLAVTGPLTDTQLRASAVPVSGPLTDTQLRASAVPVSGPLTDTQLRAAAVPISDGAGSLTVDAPVGTPLFARLSDGAAALIGQKAMASSLPVVISSDQSTVNVSLGNSTGKTNIGKPGSLASSATTANQTITGASWTVTAAKTGYIQMWNVQARLTTFAATATLFGTASLRIGGTVMQTIELAGSGIDKSMDFEFSEPIPVAAGTVIDIVCTPAAATAMTWKANLVGYEK